MIVYLLHFESRISVGHTTQHYIGICKNLNRRLKRHAAGTGSRLCEVAKERGIKFVLARIWIDVDRGFEKRLKKQKMGPRLCPICTPPTPASPESSLTGRSLDA